MTPFRCTVKGIGCLFILLVLVACASTGGAPAEEKLDPTPTPEPFQATLFGKVDLLQGGKPIKATGDTFTVLVLPEGANRALALSTDVQGWFAWRLKPGTYTVPGYVYGMGGNLTGYLNGRFRIAEDDGAVYLGHLTIDVERHEVGFRDAAEQAFEEYAKRNPQAAAPSKRLLEPAPRLGAYRGVRSACAEQWGVVCTRNVAGVEPISPVVTRGIKGSTFTRVGDTAPELSWKPSSVPGITYDLAIWEAAGYRLPWAMAGSSYIPGHLAVYEENFAEPHLRVQTPLKPKTKYYWSVRMRNGDVVSSWSRAGHFAFMLVAWTTSSGGWFAFETP